MFHVLPLLIRGLRATLLKFLHASFNDFERIVPSMSVQNVVYCLLCIDAEQFAKVWM